MITSNFRKGTIFALCLVLCFFCGMYLVEEQHKLIKRKRHLEILNSVEALKASDVNKRSLASLLLQLTALRARYDSSGIDPIMHHMDILVDRVICDLKEDYLNSTPDEQILINNTLLEVFPLIMSCNRKRPLNFVQRKVQDDAIAILNEVHEAKEE